MLQNYHFGLRSILLCSYVAVFNVLLGYFATYRVRLFLATVLGYFWHFCLAISRHFIRIYRVPNHRYVPLVVFCHCALSLISYISQCLVVSKLPF